MKGQQEGLLCQGFSTYLNSTYFNFEDNFVNLLWMSNENWSVEVFKKSTDLHVGMKLSTGCLWILFLYQLGKLPVAPDGNSSADSSNSRLFKEMSWFEKRPGQSDGWQRCLQPGREGLSPLMHSHTLIGGQSCYFGLKRYHPLGSCVKREGREKGKN